MKTREKKFRVILLPLNRSSEAPVAWTWRESVSFSGQEGWRKHGPKYFQAIREPNRVTRRVFCERLVETGEMFDDVIFTDESSIWLERHNKICFRKKGMPAKLKPKVKHPYKLHVWAGISKRGATKILIGHNEEGIFCGEHPKRHAASVCRGDVSRWASFSTR